MQQTLAANPHLCWINPCSKGPESWGC